MYNFMVNWRVLSRGVLWKSVPPICQRRVIQKRALSEEVCTQLAVWGTHISPQERIWHHRQPWMLVWCSGCLTLCLGGLVYTKSQSERHLQMGDLVMKVGVTVDCAVLILGLILKGSGHFTVCVSQHMHKITNLWKFELNWSSNLRDNNEREKHPCHTKLCAFRWLISRPQVLNLRSRNQIPGKLLLSRKLWHFRRRRFSQCSLPSTSPHYSSSRKVVCE